MNYKAIAITLAGIAIIGCFYKMIIPTGKTGKTVSFVISLMMTAALLNPILHNFSTDLEIAEDIKTSRISDSISDYEYYFYSDYLQNAIKKALSASNIKTERIAVEVAKSNTTYIAKKVYLNLSDLSYTGQDENINIPSLTKTVISRKFSVATEDIVIYE